MQVKLVDAQWKGWAVKGIGGLRFTIKGELMKHTTGSWDRDFDELVGWEDEHLFKGELFAKILVS